MPRSGFNGVDFEDNINFERLHSERLERAKKFLHESEFGALLCYDFDNILLHYRYTCRRVEQK